MKIDNGITGNILSDIKCIDANIFYEDEIPFLKYKGSGVSEDGTKFVVELNKMALDISKIEVTEENCYNENFSFVNNSFYETTFKNSPNKNKNEVLYSIYVEERNMTKEQIEKELGYKINLI